MNKVKAVAGILKYELASEERSMFSGGNVGTLGEIEDNLPETSSQHPWGDIIDQGTSSSLLFSPLHIEGQDQGCFLKREWSPEASQNDTLHTYMPTGIGNLRLKRQRTEMKTSSSLVKNLPHKPSVTISSVDSFERQKVTGKGITKKKMNTSGKKIERKRKPKKNAPNSNLEENPSDLISNKITTSLKKANGDSGNLTTAENPLCKRKEPELENMIKLGFFKDEEKRAFSWRNAMASDWYPFELILTPSYLHQVQRYNTNLDQNTNQDLISLFSDQMF